MENQSTNAGVTDEAPLNKISSNLLLAAVFVYSGKCREGDVGEPTSLKDFTGEQLFVGDIVITSTIDDFGICNNNGLTVVVSDKYTSVNCGTHTEHRIKEGEVEHFVMGIKSVDFMGKDAEKWIVKRVKSFKDVIAGEHWKDYGFSYAVE